MDSVLVFLENNLMVLLLGVLILAVIILIILVICTGREKGLRAGLKTTEEQIANQLSGFAERNDTDTRKNREEMSNNLRGMSDSVTRVMSDMARAQQEQLTGLQNRMAEMSAHEEKRIEELRATMESRLAGYESRMLRISELLDTQFDKNDTRAEAIRQTLEGRITEMQRDSAERFNRLEQTVDNRLEASLEQRLGAGFRQVSERLEQVYKGLDEMRALSTGVVDLKRVLTDVRVRGAVGEVQLGALITQFLSADQYAVNFKAKEGGDTAPFAICVPDKKGLRYLAIDAHFPAESYRRIFDEHGDAGEFENDLLDWGKRVAEQFIAPPYTCDFAILFVPTESMYSEAMRIDGLQQQLNARYHASIAGPSTLAALINSVQMGFKTLAMEQRTGEVWALLDSVKTEFIAFSEALARTQKRLRQASESIEDTARRTKSIKKQLKEMDLSGTGALPSAQEDEESDDYGLSDWD